MKQSYYRDPKKSTLFWKTSLCWQIDTISSFSPHTICGISNQTFNPTFHPYASLTPIVLEELKNRNACPGGAWLEPPASPITPHPLISSVRTFAKANCPHRTPFLFHFLPAPMAVNEISLVQITTLYSSLRNFLYDTFEGAIVGIVFSRKFRTFSGPPGNKSEFPSAQFHPNQQQFHKPYAQSHRRQKRYPSGY